MRSERNLQLVCLALIAAALITGLFAGYSSAKPALPVMAILSLLGIVVTAYLGWYCWSLHKVLASAIAKLRGNSTSAILPNESNVRALNQAIEGFLQDNTSHNGELQQQVKDLQLQVQLWQRQKANSEAIIYSIRDAVIVCDSFDKVVMANKPAGRVFGFDVKDSQQKDITELINNNEFTALLHQSRQTRSRHIRHEITLDCDSQGRTYDCVISCIFDQHQQVSGVVSVLHDITREKEISQLKNEFVSHVSHELKTPLASITAYAEMLVDGEAGDEASRNEFYSVIQSQAQRLRRLIDDILNVSRIESGLIKVNKEPVSLTILIRQAVQMIRSYAAEKDIEVIEQTPIVFDQVSADKDMISQVIINLLSNAVKYTSSKGTIKVESQLNEADGLVRMSVSDTGVGIPEEALGHVFDKFYRVSANNKYAKGTGLGLNLVKQIVEKVHNGRVFVTSKVGQGSTFGFELPIEAERAVESV